MPGMNPADYLKTYTVNQLEAIACEQLKKLRGLTIPIDIETIVEDFQKIDIDVKRGLKDRHKLWGMVSTDLDTGDILIVVDDQLLDLDHLFRIYRMTIAEEFAHLLLHRDAIIRIKNIEDFEALQKHQDWHKHDRNAKWLAAALLVPAGHVLDDSRKFYRQLVSTVGYGDLNVVQKYLRNLLADKYLVSVSAMSYRLQNWPVNVVEKVERAIRDELPFLD